jgi:hypothetical protein
VGDVAHRSAIEAVFSKNVGRMVKQGLASYFGYLHNHNFLATELTASPMYAMIETTRESEAEMILPRFDARLIP